MHGYQHASKDTSPFRDIAPVCPLTCHSRSIPKSGPLSYFMKECAELGMPAPVGKLFITRWGDVGFTCVLLCKGPGRGHSSVSEHVP